MAFEFFSANNVVLDVVPFANYTLEGETAEAAYEKRKTRVMEWLVGLGSRHTLGAQYHPTKDAYPDAIDMAIIKTTNPERWERLELDAISDLALNGYHSPAPELTLVTPTAEAASNVPASRFPAETSAPVQRSAA